LLDNGNVIHHTFFEDLPQTIRLKYIAKALNKPISQLGELDYIDFMDKSLWANLLLDKHPSDDSSMKKLIRDLYHKRPTVLILDYVQCIKCEDDIIKVLQKLAKSLNILIIASVQGDRKSISERMVRPELTSWENTYVIDLWRPVHHKTENTAEIRSYHMNNGKEINWVNERATFNPSTLEIQL
jgi:hypothetical protein